MRPRASKPDWPRCGGETAWGGVCEGAGDGIGGRCRWHGGLDLPRGRWALLYVTTGIYLVEDETGSHTERRHRVSWRIAARLVSKGRVARGVFFRRLGDGFIRRVATGPIEPRQTLKHSAVREYLFLRRETLL